MNDPRPAVVAPLREEIAALLGRAEHLRKVPVSGPGRYLDAELAGRPVVLGWTGDGRRAAHDGLHSLLARRRVGRLAIIGVAGGLVPELRVGDVVVAREIRDIQGDIRDGIQGSVPRPVPPPVEGVELPGTHRGVLLTHRHILARATDKLALGREHGGDTVDLETAVYARVAAEHGVPYTALRAVSDPATDDLVVDFDRFCDADGHTRRWRVVVHALAHPGSIPALRRLERQVRLCGERLGDAVIAWLRELPP